MELYEIKQGLIGTMKKLHDLGESLENSGSKEKLAELEKAQNEEDFWNDAKKAQHIIKEYNTLKDILDTFDHLNSTFEEVSESVEMLQKDYDEELHALVEEEYLSASKAFEDFEVKVLLSNDYDHSNAVLEIHPGAGGTESQDWAEMLYRMYQRYAAKNGYGFEVLDYQVAEEAGLKSCTVVIKGNMAYGYLKGESGIHRLVRISPFDAAGRRHTSFASVEITPEFNDEVEIEIDEKDLEIETMRSSGAGGQHINKTDSAVRIHHIPTGIVVFSQSQRSQIQNREYCMQVLKSKLYQRAIEEQENKKRALKGEQKKIEWGSQIRSYVFCPYTLVKDHRTNFEETNIQKVMDGEISDFLFAYLKSMI